MMALTFHVAEPWSGTGWPVSLFDNKDSLLEKGIYFCTREECCRTEKRITRDPWQFSCGHRVCKACHDHIRKNLLESQQVCDACKKEPESDDAIPSELKAGNKTSNISTNQNSFIDEPFNGSALNSPLAAAANHVTAPSQIIQKKQVGQIDFGKAKSDSAANREINRMAVTCPFNCGKDILTIKTLEKHMRSCKERQMRCDNCAAIIMPSEQKTHICRSPGMDVAMETESAGASGSGNNIPMKSDSLEKLIPDQTSAACQSSGSDVAVARPDISQTYPPESGDHQMDMTSAHMVVDNSLGVTMSMQMVTDDSIGSSRAVASIGSINDPPQPPSHSG